MTSSSTWRGLLLCLLLWPGTSLAQSRLDPLVIAIAPCPPFVMTSEGNISGLAVYLWQEVAAEMGVEYEFREFTLREMLEAIADKGASRQLDVGLSCLSITADRENISTFPIPFMKPSLGLRCGTVGSPTS